MFSKTTAGVVVATAFAYAILRYNIIKGVSWEHFPLLISNKAIALSAVGLIALSYILGSLARFFPRTFSATLGARKFFGLTGFGLAAMHGLMSLLLFSPKNYPKFFLEDGSLSLTGELSMLFGVLAFFVFSIVAYTSIPVIVAKMDKHIWHRAQKLGYLGLLLTLLHVVSMGFSGWLNTAGWPGGLLPISLLAAIILAFALLFKLIALVTTRAPAKN